MSLLGVWSWAAVLYDGEYGAAEYQGARLIVRNFDYRRNYLSFAISHSMHQLYPATAGAMITSVLEMRAHTIRV